MTSGVATGWERAVRQPRAIPSARFSGYLIVLGVALFHARLLHTLARLAILLDTAESGNDAEE
eukprot:7384053-Prymnesium_polylepis.4